MSSQYSCSSAGGASPPATNVRVMSAQQRDSRSRGQMSIRTMPPRSIGPWPSSWPEADCAPWATIAVSGSSASCSLQTACMRSRTCSHVSPAGSSRSSSAAAPIAASAAAWARRMPASCALGLHAPPEVEGLGVDGQLDPRAAQLVGPREREVGRHDRRLEPQLAARAQVDLDLGVEEADALLEQRVEAERERVEHLDAEPERLDAVALQHADHRDLAAVVLGVEERVEDVERERVEEVGGRARAPSACSSELIRARGSRRAGPAARGRGG